MATDQNGDQEENKEVQYREVKWRHSSQFLPLMASLDCSLLISTYQAGKLIVVGTHNGEFQIELHNFEQAMGTAVQGDRIAVGARNEVWFLHSAHQLAPTINPAGSYDGCFVTRSATFTGQIHIHEMDYAADGELWVVNTLFSCLCTLHPEFNFVPRWRPQFISNLAAEDRCHLNGLAMVDGRPRYVTAMSETDVYQGWRPTKNTSGCLIDITNNEVVARGMSMPHSPRVYNDRMWVLDSGRGNLSTIDFKTGKIDPVDAVPGFTRGLAFYGPFAFVGMSRIRETSTFGGVPIAENKDSLRCGVAVIDLRIGQAVAYLEFMTGVEEVFDVKIVPRFKHLAVFGPNPHSDTTPPVWIVPAPGEVPKK